MSGTQRATPADLAKFRLERNAALLATSEQPAYWAGVLAGLKASNVLGTVAQDELRSWVEHKVTT